MSDLHGMLTRASGLRGEWHEKLTLLRAETDATSAGRIPPDVTEAQQRFETLSAHVARLDETVEKLERLVDDTSAWLDEQTVPIRRERGGRGLVFGMGSSGDLTPISLPAQVAKSIHAEFELRYMAPLKWKPPKKLAGFKRGETRYIHQRNRYFEAFSANAPDGVLGAAGCSFRIRETHDTVIATLKIKPPDANVGARTKRLEVEHPIDDRYPRPGQTAYDVALEVSGGARLIEHFTVSTFRRATIYTDDRGNVIEIAQDAITYPDGSTEDRLEAEVITGKPKLLRRVEKALLAADEMEPAPRGKRAEAKRRLGLGLAPVV